LTDRERTLLGLLSGARSDAEVAAELEISETMAKIQVRQLLAKLKLHDRVQAVVLTLRVRAGDAQSLT
jgi:DNA-binding CsgD family transcriptional regulator